ncbi:hypothetical protein VQ045_08605 [Aurantimonas sp. E1-2-R+4]|uniref:hypothetical protein n=1 Tax=Aurantimonas sp. E1-2-R+4 TaxID=3113714 RepID=UPI002F95562E
MTDKALENAESKKKQLVDRRLELHSEIAALDKKIGHIDAFIRDWHSFAGGVDEIPVDNSDQKENKQESSGDTPKRATGNSRKEEVAAVAREIILTRGSPIMRDELFELLTSCGVVIQGKDPRMVLSTMLWRMRDYIVRVKGGGYWPTDIANAEFDYDPNAAQEMDTVHHTPEGEIADSDVAESEFNDDEEAKSLV